MRGLLQGRVGLIAKLLLLCLMALSLLPLSCSQGGRVEGVVHYKTVSGMKDRVYTILVTNEPTDTDGEPSIPSIVVHVEESDIRRCFRSEGDLVVDNSTEKIIEEFYTRVDYVVSLHIMSGNEYTYYQACRADREDFNQLKVGSIVTVDTIPSSEGPRITGIVG
jgi:hypothetical protein